MGERRDVDPLMSKDMTILILSIKGCLSTSNSESLHKSARSIINEI